MFPFPRERSPTRENHKGSWPEKSSIDPLLPSLTQPSSLQEEVRF